MSAPGVNGGSTGDYGRRVCPRDGDIFRVFVSFSSKDNRRGEISNFVRDLKAMFEALSGFEEDEYSIYLSDDQGRQGGNWPTELNRELNRADVLMPVMSPAFFRSEWCAQEWGAFEERLASLPDVEVPDRIIPIVWYDEQLPPAARPLRIGWGPEHVPDYRKVGLPLLQGEDPRQYGKAVRLLAAELELLVEDGERLPALDPIINVPSAALAFPPRQANPTCASWQYYLLHASVSADGLEILETTESAGAGCGVGSQPTPEKRDTRHYYGGGSEQWDPFRPVGDPGLESRVRRMIEDEAWSHRMRPVKTGRKVLDFRYGIPREITERRDTRRTVVIVPMDAWLIQFETWRSHARDLVALTGARIVLLAPKAPDRQFHASWNTRLDDDLRSAVNGGSDTDAALFQGAPDDADMFIRDLRKLLPQACCGNRSPSRRACGMPILSGPGGGVSRDG